ncbi:peptidylprolyl isomerase [Gammaproteobacteria bacterium]|nr:peptidylprolyl isomerase [Gammaproteobacteria bacterium]MDC0509166.1 peptidylprolyl isomerase [Gammaproteobacteria bacterium]MDC0545991.1 peptidylprolyl isomerase [Gammaproteobacteria bacterium]MDC3323342.1 peptidylprolyl isomerase [Gammaproteobacteria bacterium]
MAKRLFIFLVLGILILIADLTFNEESDNKITIFESEINSLIGTWVNQVGREPTLQEVDGIIKQLLDEEILYREAIKLGLDKNDIIIKRRLAQKIGFLRQEADSSLPSEEEVSDFYNKNIDKYFVGKRITFSHIYFSSNENDKTLADEALTLIRSGSSESDFGEPFLLGKNFSSKTITEIERSFGLRFSKDIQSITPKVWSGPLISEYGSHLIFVNSISNSFTPALEEIKNIIINDLILENQNNSVKEYLKELRNKYQIEILADLNEISD